MQTCRHVELCVEHRVVCHVCSVCSVYIELESCVQRIELLVATGIKHIVMALLTVYCGLN